MSEKDAERELAALKAAHTPAAIRKRLQAGPDHSHLRDFVYGAIDGAVTTFAVVSGVAGAQLATGIVIVLGASNLVADGFSMAVSNYLGTRAEEQLRQRAREIEEEEIERYPEAEREEGRQIVRSKGFEGEELERAVEIITSDRRRWVDTMLTEEWGLSLKDPSPVRAGAATFLAFVLIGAIPLLPFLVQYLRGGAVAKPFLWSSLLTGVAFFAVGAAKSRVVNQDWRWAGVETLLIGGGAASLAYAIGWLLRNLV